jgi:transposase
MSPKPRRHFTDQQKAEILQLLEASGRTVAELSAELGIAQSSLNRWRRNARAAAAQPGGPLSADEREELRRLQQEVKHLQRERDFLKQAATFFATQQSPRNSL